MTTLLIKEETFHSRWLDKDGVVTVTARRFEDKGCTVKVKIDDECYEEVIPDLSWQISKMLWSKAAVIADAVIFKYRCVTADNEVWLMSGSLSAIIRISCVTGRHFCEGMQFVISEKRSDDEIRFMISDAVENEPPF